MLQYSELIQEFDPLCHVWSKRFEAKYQYFKQHLKDFTEDNVIPRNILLICGKLLPMHQHMLLLRHTFYVTDLGVYVDFQPVSVSRGMSQCAIQRSLGSFSL